MELAYLSAIFLYTLLPCLITLIFLHFTRKKSSSAKDNLPPGKLGLPFIGESLHFMKSGRLGHPEKFLFDRLSKHSSPVFKTSIYTEPTIILHGHNANKLIFSTENNLVSSWWPDSFNKFFPSSVQNSSQAETVKLRRIVLNLMRPEALVRSIGTMDSTAQKHVDFHWNNKSQVVVSSLARNYAFSAICKVLLGIEDSCYVAELLEPFDALVKGMFSIPINFPGTPFYKGLKESAGIRKSLSGYIKQRKVQMENGSGNEDVLSNILKVINEDGDHRYSESDIADKIIEILIGGLETTSCVIACLMKYLAEFPQVYDKVLQEQMEISKSKNPGELLSWDDINKMKYSWNVVCEVLRLHPPLPGAFREVIQDFHFAGFSIPKGWKVYWSASATHRSPEYFPGPEKFDPTRFEGKRVTPYTFIPFGGGPRMCPGNEYARLEILVFLHNAIKRFKWETLLPHEKVIANPSSAPANGLPIRLIPRHP